MTNNMHVAIRAVFWNNYLLRRVAVDDAIFQYGGSTQPSQDPTRYRIWNNCIELPALPASAEELKVYYYYRPATLSNNGDVPGFGDEYAEAVIYLAASYLDCASNDDKKENKFYQRYLALQKRLQSLRIGFESNIIIPSDPLEVKHRQHGY